MTTRPALRLSPAALAARLGEDHPPTGEQSAAICAPLRPRLVVAGAGSGKTQTMGLRVVWLVANGLIAPHRVLGLTFTRKAAAELGERVRRMLRRLLAAHHGDPFLTDDVVAALAAGEPTVSTYHSYAATLVGEHSLRDGLEPDTRLIGEAVTWQYAAQVVESYDGPMDAVDRAVSSVTGDVLSLAAELSEHLCRPAEVVALTAAVREHLIGLPRAPGQRTRGAHPAVVSELLASMSARLDLLPMVARYSDLKRSRGAMDYGDQVAVAARIAREHPQVGEIERARFGAVLLDEYQDTGEAQRALLTSLYGSGHPVTAVGDPRQSIYGWRGASAGNLERFLADFGADPATDVSGLSVSFRNGEPILAVANEVASGIRISGLADRPLTPGPGRDGAGRVICALHESVADEARWIAERVVAVAADDRGDEPARWGRFAVLARKRSHFPRIEAELRARGVPCEVVGLGGLLLEPEIVDVVSTLRVLGDPTAGNAAVRLLAGPRWRIGPRDLAALGHRARRLAVRADRLVAPVAAVGPVAAVAPVAAGAEDELDLDRVDPDYDVVDERSLIDAIDDLGPPGAYTPVGFDRLARMREELRLLRRATAQPLPDLVATVARTLCLDVELASRPGVRPGDALLNVDRFVEVAEDFAAAGDDPGLLAFLAYLDAAEERERGLEQELGDSDGERVQLLTVHAAKGLEWDVVFVAGLTRTVFPVEGQPVADWSKQLSALPFPLRGDRDDLPSLDWAATTDQADSATAVTAFREHCRARGALEERRLAYVAVTRARDTLACSGYWWDTATKPRGPSHLLTSIRDVCLATGQLVAVWTNPPADGAGNPLTATPPTAEWPLDPLGPRRGDVQAAAALVRSLLANPGVGSVADQGVASLADPGVGSVADPGVGQREDPGARQRIRAWREEADLLLAELARTRAIGPPLVELPSHLSVSQLVALRRDPAELARQIRRPLPRRPAPSARRGTRFHAWLEQRWGQQRLIDMDEMPGAADDTAAPDADLSLLQQAFLDSVWARREPEEIELPFDLMVDGVLLRGRVDAVFTDDPDGLVDVVDWKTGRPPTGGEAAATAVQLAVYRLAWHHLSGTPLERVRAAFHYVAANATVRPADLGGHDELVALIRSVPVREDRP